jgi:mono/diheme cytochrome c family protein
MTPLRPTLMAACLLPMAAMGGEVLSTTLGRQVVFPEKDTAAATIARPAANYALHCAGCHGMTGAGTESARVPGLRRLGDMLKVPGGRSYMISVPGLLGSGLNDEQTADVMNWTLSTLARSSLPPQFTPFAASEIAIARARPPLDVAALRRALVERGRQLNIAVD